MEGDYIKINRWLRPLSFLYGLGVELRSQLFELNILKSRSFTTPVISVGNITVGGTGKTPHVEYLVRLLSKEAKVAVLSRGYKRKTHGYLLADKDSTMRDIGDEPYQMKLKFPNIEVAVDANRCEGIDHLINDEQTKDTDVIILDDAYQHRYVKPGINILLVDYHRLIIYDELLPSGRLREPIESKKRADIVIITKCPDSLNPIDYRVLTKAMKLYAYQSLFFTSLHYGAPYLLFGGDETRVPKKQNSDVLLLTGIASPEQMIDDVQPNVKSLKPLTFPDHHAFSPRDIEKINNAFAAMPQESRVILTTEKDAARLRNVSGLSEDVKQRLLVLPVEVKFMLDGEEIFNDKIKSYVRKNSRNSILVKRKDDDKPKNSNNPGHRTRTISFRDN
jgi:tetraacyldisaccharide 4'-kinase